MNQMTFKTASGVKEDDFILDLTNIALHFTPMRETQYPGKKIRESIETGDPGRIYQTTSPEMDLSDNKVSILSLLLKDPSVAKMVEDYQKIGRKVLVRVPQGSIPLIMGKDYEEFANSVKGQRIIRRIIKKNMT